VKAITGLILAVICVYIGVSSLHGLNTTVATITTPTYSVGVAGIVQVVPIVLGAAIIMIVLNAFGTKDNAEESTEVKVKSRKNSRGLICYVKNASESLSQYFNNLDELLGIQTVNDMRLSEYGLSLDGNKLSICGGDTIWDWYITEKHPEADWFKVVGLHKKDEAKNKVFILGKHLDNQKPFLYELDKSHIKEETYKDTEHLKWMGLDKELIRLDKELELVKVPARIDEIEETANYEENIR
jgi:hypothetical protein